MRLQLGYGLNTPIVAYALEMLEDERTWHSQSWLRYTLRQIEDVETTVWTRTHRSLPWMWDWWKSGRNSYDALRLRDCIR